jgi:hypothetical protein
MDGSQLEEDFICAEYQTFYGLSLDNSSDMRQSRYVKITGPIASKQTDYAGYPDTIYHTDNGVTQTWGKDYFIGLWKANNDEYQHVLVDGVYRDKIISYSSNAEYAIITFPYVDDDGYGNDVLLGNGQYLFSKPDKGRVKVYGVFLNSDGSQRPRELIRTIRKVADDTVDGAVPANWPVD